MISRNGVAGEATAFIQDTKQSIVWKQVIQALKIAKVQIKQNIPLEIKEKKP